MEFLGALTVAALVGLGCVLIRNSHLSGENARLRGQVRELTNGLLWQPGDDLAFRVWSEREAS